MSVTRHRGSGIERGGGTGTERDVGEDNMAPEVNPNPSPTPAGAATTRAKQENNNLNKPETAQRTNQ